MDKLAVPIVSLEAKVAFLRLPSSYAERALRVDAIETHMAWVFLTSCFAYKLKKPVHNADLDFSTVEARHYFCEEELRLNRRLAADVYLGLVALRLDSAGHLRLDGVGTPVDWLVMMRRLPAENMLDYAMLHGLATDSDMRRVARRLAAFYRRCAPLRIDPPSYRQRFAYGITRHRTAMAALCSTAADARVERLCHGQYAALQRVGALLDQRVQGQRILDGHGDLRPEHICLWPRVRIIDALEFSAQLRTSDPADELAFLALETERGGACGLGRAALEGYAAAAHDHPRPELIEFYQSYRASVRAGLAATHLTEEKFRHSSYWSQRANEYLALAELHLERCLTNDWKGGPG